ncbi:protein RhsE, partial [Escherichia coli TT12B]
PEQPGV